MISYNFKQFASNYSLFIKYIESFITILLIYVGDLIIFSNNFTKINITKIFLQQHFKICDLGDLKYFVSFEITRSKLGDHICEHKYILDIFSNTGLLDSKPTSTPMIKDSRLQKNN